MDDENAVAIVGIACRFPGADDIDEYWENLKEGKCFIDEVPKERWNTNEADVRDVDESWKDRSKYAALIKEHDKWDNKFFGVSNSEAEWTNPQHCLALEVTYSALENAGYTKDEIKGSKTGVYIGAMNDDFLIGLSNSRNELNNFVVTGMAPSITSNRISYYFDLRGPSMTLDTACSSALVAVHLGCQSIRSGESETAICGGVNSILSPLTFIPLSKAKMISPTGTSHAFMKDANGYVRGEGCGIVILKNYKKALLDGDHIWGLIGTGCNQDGHTNTPITSPSSTQQHSLLKDIYSKFRVDPATIQYIEAHGTGTPVGDPIEVKALATFFTSYLENHKSILIGSVKTNIGHLESSAGTAGLIKTLLMMNRRQYVPSLHFKRENANPAIDFDNISLQVSTVVSDWNAYPDGSRIACVNSFGFGGTNCHAIVKTLPNKESSHNTENEFVLICFSANSLEALMKTTDHTKQCLSILQYSMIDLSYTSLVKRNHFRFRMPCVASNQEELEKEISRKYPNIGNNTSDGTTGRNLIFLFCGVGTVWKGTCQKMISAYTCFREKFQEVDEELQKFTKFSLIDEIQKPDDSIASNPFKGPLIIFACQVSMFYLWSVLNVKPDIIIGQSVGEVAAAHASGCLSLSDAVKIIYHRSFLSAKARGGSMMVIGKCNVKEIQKLCNEYHGRVCIAVYSSREACVVSGDKDAISNMKHKLDSEMPELLKKELDVGCAYHSHHMDNVSKDIEKKLVGLSGKAPAIALISTVTGATIKDDAMGSPSYWTQNLRDPVLLMEAVTCALQEKKSNIIVEIGPKPVVKAHLKKITDFNVVSIPSMNQPNEQQTFTCALGDLYEHDVNVKWDNLFNGSENVVDIPRYKYCREGNLINADSLKAGLRLKFQKSSNHGFISQAPMSKDFKIEITPITTPYVYEHTVHERKIAPGALHAEIALTVATKVLDLSLNQIEIDLNFIRPLAVGQNQSLQLQALVTDNRYYEIKRNADIICRGRIIKAGRQVLKHISLSSIKNRCQIRVESSSFYHQLKMLGFEYGESLAVIGDCLKSDCEYIAEINLPSSVSCCLNSHSLHPAILDGALQTVVLCYTQTHKSQFKDKPIPVGISSLRVYRPMEPKMYIIGKKIKSNLSATTMNLFIINECGDIFVEIKGYEVKNIAHETTQETVLDKMYKIVWKPSADSQEEKIERQNIFSITFTNEAKHILENIFKDENHYIVSLPFDYDRVTIQELLEVLFKYIETKLERMENISHILFFPGLTCKSTDQNTDEIFTAVKASCVVLVRFIQHLVKERIGEIPTFIITQQTQMKAKHDDESWVNVIGSELWGMVRCFLRERIFSTLRLIDFEKETDLFLLKELVFNSNSGQLQSTPEFKLQGKCLYTNQICKFLVEEPTFRKNTYTMTERVDLKSDHHETLEDLVFVPEKDHLSNTNFSPSHVKFRVTSVFVSDMWISKTTTQAICDFNPWIFHTRDGHQIITSETTGFLEQSAKLYTDSTTCFHKSRVDTQRFSRFEEYVTCFPCSASNFICVPDQCILEKKLFTTYRPGMLLEIVMYFALLEAIKENSPLLAFMEQDMSLTGHLLEYIFQHFKHKLILHRNVESMKTAMKSGRYQMVLLTNNLSNFKDICNMLGGLDAQVYTFSSLINKSSERNIRHQFPNVSLTQINCDQVLCKEMLGKTLPKVKRWLLLRQVRSTLRDIDVPVYQNGHVISFEKNIKSTDELVAQNIPVARLKHQLFSKHALYIIIGGLTGLGWEILKAISKGGGGILVSISRRSPNDIQRDDINEVEKESGCRIKTIKADISVFSSISEGFAQIKSSFPDHAIKGIFHGAAVVDDALLPDMTEEKFDKVLRPKVMGTWNLHLLSKDLTLDYFVLHSSITSAFGNAGQTNYGAGNAFKDATAFFRRGIGLAGQTINWGALKLGLIDEKTEKHLKSQGFLTMKENEIIQCFLYSLFVDPEQIICGIMDWKTVIKVSPDMLHIASRIQPIIDDLHLHDLTNPKKNKTGFMQVMETEELQNLPSNERKIKVEKIVSHIAADTCAVDITMLKVDTRLASLGIDSMKGMAFINNVYKYVSCKIPILAVMEEESTIGSITTLILEQILKCNDGERVRKSKKRNKKSDKQRKADKLIEETRFQVVTETENKTDIAFKIRILNGKEPKRLQWQTNDGENIIDFSEITNIQMKGKSGTKVLQVDTKNERYVFKSSDMEEVVQLLKQLEENFIMPNSTNL